MSLLLISYPKFSAYDYGLIQDFRKTHDALYYDLVKPHFTFVFPVFDVPEEMFIREISSKAMGTSPIEFSMRCAIMNKDTFNEYYHSFLVPDEGFSHMVRLHDKLYSDLLQSNLRLDITFIPHINIGNSVDQYACKKMVDEWNHKNLVLHGTIEELTIIRFENNLVTDLNQIQLKP